MIALDKKVSPEVDKKHDDISEPMTLEQRVKRARISKEALQNSTMRISDKVREAKAAVEPSVMLTRPVPKSIPEVKVQSQGMNRTTGDASYSSLASPAFTSGGLGRTGRDDQRKHDLYKPAIEFAAKSIAAGNYKRATDLVWRNIEFAEQIFNAFFFSRVRNINSSLSVEHIADKYPRVREGRQGVSAVHPAGEEISTNRNSAYVVCA